MTEARGQTGFNAEHTRVARRRSGQRVEGGGCPLTLNPYIRTAFVLAFATLIRAPDGGEGDVTAREEGRVLFSPHQNEPRPQAGRYRYVPSFPSVISVFGVQRSVFDVFPFNVFVRANPAYSRPPSPTRIPPGTHLRLDCVYLHLFAPNYAYLHLFPGKKRLFISSGRGTVN
jgi:hypothetical protein